MGWQSGQIEETLQWENGEDFVADYIGERKEKSMIFVVSGDKNFVITLGGSKSLKSIS